MGLKLEAGNLLASGSSSRNTSEAVLLSLCPPHWLMLSRTVLGSTPPGVFLAPPILAALLYIPVLHAGNSLASVTLYLVGFLTRQLPELESCRVISDPRGDQRTRLEEMSIKSCYTNEWPQE